MSAPGITTTTPKWQHSNKPLDIEWKVQHRSDILMKEQMKSIAANKDLLTAAIRQLQIDSSKSVHVDEQKQIVEDLEKELEKKMLIFQLMHKINTELAYARSDLQTALQEHKGDIIAARKRVTWLEDKMGDLCGKKRLKSKVKKDEVPDSSVTVNNTKKSLAPEIAVAEVADVIHPMNSDLVVYSPLNQDIEGNLSSTIEAASVCVGRADSPVTSDKNGDDCVAGGRADSPVTGDKNGDDCVAGGRADSPVTGNENDDDDCAVGDGSDILVTGEKNDEDNDNSYIDNHDVNDKHDSDNDDDTDDDADDDSTREDNNKTLTEFKGETIREESSKLPTFITQTSFRTTPNTSNKKVFVCNVQEDAAEDYWNSEHHRLDLGEYFNELIDNDPLSYHNLGIAVPGSFLEREDSDFNNLPWRIRRKGSDIKDVHRIALDKLAVKLKKMYNKVYDAAMLSVIPLNRHSASRQNTTTTNKLLSQASTKETPATLSLPKVVTNKRGRVSAKMVYYPKPIPPPEVLPITRTSKDKEFPRYSDSFAEPGADVRFPAERIVDQRNLMEETKLVLYCEKPKPKREGLSTTEKRFRRMLERDRTLSSAASSEIMEETEAPITVRKKLKKGFALAKNMAKLKNAAGGWHTMKSHGRGNEYSGLRWERVKSIVHTNLLSERPEERTDAAKQLGILRCGDTMVFYALKERLQKDSNERVRYEAAKSLILIGCWDNEVLQVILKFLITGNTEIRLDLIINMAQGKNVQYVNKSISAFKELVKVLSHFCCNPDPDDPISMEAAVLLGKLCVADVNAKAKLSNALSTSNDSYTKAKALEILVKQLNCTDRKVVQNLKELLQTSPVSKHRALSTKLLISIGPNHQCIQSDSEDIYNLLERKLWDEPSHDVRVSAGKALTALGMFSKACESVEKRLEDRDEEVRAEAVVSVGTLGMRGERLTRLLLEMLELDTSEYVRIMIIRSFSILKLTDRRVIRCLREREKLEGSLGIESKKAMKILESCIKENTPRSSLLKTQLPANLQIAV